jgi:MoxR-like ATPase
MPDLFMVLATQNPVEQEGTYPLPEAQMDRFLMHVLIDYPPEDSEIEILRLVRSEERGPDAAEAEPIAQQVVFAAREEIRSVHMSEAVERYVVALVWATRDGKRYSQDLGRWIKVGASPRGGIALDRCSRARAWLEGRDHVTPDDVRSVAGDCLRHRIMLSYEASAEGLSTQAVVNEVVKLVAVA